MAGVRLVLLIFSVHIISGILFFQVTFAFPEQPHVQVEEETEVPLTEIDTSLSLETTDTVLHDGRGRQYTFHSVPLTWFESVLHCWRNDGQLAVAHSTEEAKALADLLLASAAEIDESATMFDAIHVAVHDMGSSSLWTTLDGRKLSETGYDLWIEGGEGRCGALFADGRYFQQPCNTKLAFICESVSPRKELIAKNYTLIPGVGRFRLYESPLTWPQARLRCEEEGGTLAVPTSGRAAGLLAGTMLWRASPTTRARGCFVGVTDIAKEGAWTTVGGKDLISSGYSSWRGSEPSGNRSENCAVLMEDGLYIDYPCLSPLAFCCEISGAGPIGTSTTVLSDDGYQFNTEPLTWLDALIACRKQNMSLAFPRDDAEGKNFRRLVSKANSRDNAYYDRIHLGVYKRTSDTGDEWVTLNNDLVWSSMNSAQLHTNRRRNTNRILNYPYGLYGNRDEFSCAIFLRNQNEYYASSCFESHPYVCE